MEVRTISMTADEGGRSQKLAVTTASTVSSILNSITSLVTADALVFFRGNLPGAANPTAVSDGTDRVLLANTTYRITHAPGVKLAFICPASTANVYITPEV